MFVKPRSERSVARVRHHGQRVVVSYKMRGLVAMYESCEFCACVVMDTLSRVAFCVTDGHAFLL